MNLNVDADDVINELSMQVAQFVRDNTMLKVQNASLVRQAGELEQKLQNRASTEEGDGK